MIHVVMSFTSVRRITYHRSKSESESSSFFRMFLPVDLLVRVPAERMREDASSELSSSSSSLSRRSRFGTSCGVIAPASKRTVSSSTSETVSGRIAERGCKQTFDPSFPVRPPCNDLVDHLTVAVDDDHGYAGVGQVWNTFVSDDGDEFRVWVPLCEATNVFEGTVAPRYAVVKLNIDTLASQSVGTCAYPSLYRKHTTPVPCPSGLPSCATWLASVTSRV